MSQLYIGTSGYIGSKKDWELSESDSEGFNCLEINSTFYRLPTQKSILNFKQLKGVVFSIKVSRFITHIKRLKDCKEAFKTFWNSINELSPRIRVLLFQLPPSFHYNDINMQRLRELDFIPQILNKKIDIVFEFRDVSWFEKQDVIELFKTRNWTLGGTFIEKKSGGKWMGTMPNGLHIPNKTSDCTYLRIHGARGYRGYYDKPQLIKFESAIKKQKTKNNFILFNNVFFPKRGKTCKIKSKKIRYAALCDANLLGKMTRKNKKHK